MALMAGGKQCLSFLAVMGKYIGPKYTRSSIFSRQLCINYTEKKTFMQRGYSETSADTEKDMLSSDSKHVQSQQKHKITGKYQKKLHNRVLTAEEQTDNEELILGEKPNFADDDTFGSLSTRSKSKVSSAGSSWQPDRTDFGVRESQETTRDAHHLPRSSSHVHLYGDRTYGRETSFNTSHGKGTEHRRRYGSSRSWRDQFGTLQDCDIEDRIEESLSTTVGSHEERFSDDEDEQEGRHVRLSKYNRRHIPEWYGRKIIKLGKKGQVREAIKVFDEWMLKEDRVMPNSYVFTCLITVLGRAGYTKKAFSLFNQMKKMGLEPKPATYTGLFNACSNSPWKEDGRSRADNLYRLMKEQEVEPTYITSKAMVKAFAVCGDLAKAFSLMDELSRNHRLDAEAFCHLLMACVSDKEEGLKHAIQVWRLMGEMKVQPSLHLYNLLLRCVRDCGVGDLQDFQILLTGKRSEVVEQAEPRNMEDIESGDPETSCDVLLQSQVETPLEGHCSAFSSEESSALGKQGDNIGSGSSQFDQLEEDDKLQEGRSSDALSVQSEVTKAQSLEMSVQLNTARIPDVLTSASDSSGIVSLGDLTTRQNKLALLGGAEGILTRMRRDLVNPDIITFTQLLTVAKPTVEEEEWLLVVMEKMNVQPDIDIVNALIHKRCMRKDFESAKAARELIGKYDLTANQMTYGVLAMTCRTVKDAKQLLEDMEAEDLAPNIEIMGALMHTANMNFNYRLWVLQQIQKFDLVPHDRILKNIERARFNARRLIVEAETREEYDSFFLSREFQQRFQRFVEYYENWLTETKVQIPNHPWTAFRPVKETESASS